MNDSSGTLAAPQSAPCSLCGAGPAQRCITASGLPCQPHRARVRLAAALAAHSDLALDEFPGLGPKSPCGLCGVPGLPQRHRVVDAIAGRLAAEEDREEVAEDYGLPMVAVEAVAEWAKHWPGAWL